MRGTLHASKSKVMPDYVTDVVTMSKWVTSQRVSIKTEVGSKIY